MRTRRRSLRPRSLRRCSVWMAARCVLDSVVEVAHGVAHMCSSIRYTQVQKSTPDVVGGKRGAQQGGTSMQKVSIKAHARGGCCYCLCATHHIATLLLSMLTESKAGERSAHWNGEHHEHVPCNSSGRPQHSTGYVQLNVHRLTRHVEYLTPALCSCRWEEPLQPSRTRCWTL